MDTQFSYEEFQQLSILHDPDRQFNEKTGELRGVRAMDTVDKEQEKYLRIYPTDVINPLTNKPEYKAETLSYEDWCEAKAYKANLEKQLENMKTAYSHQRADLRKEIFNIGFFVYNDNRSMNQYFTGSGDQQENYDTLKDLQGYTVELNGDQYIVSGTLSAEMCDVLNPVYLSEHMKPFISFKAERERSCKHWVYSINHATEYDLKKLWYWYNRARYTALNRCRAANEGKPEAERNWYGVYLTKEQDARVYAAFAARGIQSKKLK